MYIYIHTDGERTLHPPRDPIDTRNPPHQVGYTPLMHCVDMSGPVVWEGLEPTLRILMRRAHLPYLEVHAQVKTIDYHRSHGAHKPSPTTP